MAVENPDIREEGRKWRDWTAWIILLGVLLCVGMFVFAVAQTGFGGANGPTYPNKVPTQLPGESEGGRGLLLWLLTA